jgi:hypothetical protein
MASSVALRGVGSAGHRLGRTTAGPNSGNTYDEARFILEVEDEFSFGDVTALKSLLDNISPLIGKCITDDGTHPGVTLFGQSLDRCGTKGRGATGTHASVTAKLAHLLITEFGGSKNQLATASVRGVNLLKTGEARPSVTVYNATLPSSVVADEAFKIGPVEVADTVLGEDEIVSVAIETGITVEVVKGLDGYARTLLILKSMPRIRIAVEDSSLLADAKLDYEGIAALHANTFVSFIALDPAGGNKALNGLHHIKVTANGRAYIEDHLSGGGPAVAGTTIVIETTETAAGVAPLVVTTGVALA